MINIKSTILKGGGGGGTSSLANNGIASKEQYVLKSVLYENSIDLNINESR